MAHFSSETREPSGQEKKDCQSRLLRRWTVGVLRNEGGMTAFQMHGAQMMTSERPVLRGVLGGVFREGGPRRRRGCEFAHGNTDRPTRNDVAGYK